MSYAKKKLMRIDFPLFDFGGTANTEIMSFKIPKDENGNAQRAVLVDVGVMITEATVFATTLGTVKVGLAADDDEFALLNIATAVADAACFNVDNDADAIIDEDIPSGSLVQMTFAPGTGAGLAGIGIPYVDIYVWN
jgi:hypothetical protein